METAIKIVLALFLCLLSFTVLTFSFFGLILRFFGISFEDISYSSFGTAIGVSAVALVVIWQQVKRCHRLEND